MRRMVSFLVVVDIDETTFTNAADPDAELRDFQEIVLRDVSQVIGREAVRVLQFHADAVTLADSRAQLSRPYDPAMEPF